MVEIKRTIKFIILFLTVFFGTLNFLELIILAKEAEKKRSKEIIIIADENSINILDLSNNKRTLVDGDGIFKTIHIDEYGNSLTYIKDGFLCFADISEDDINITKIEEGIIAYNWQNNNTLIYLTNEGSLKNFDVFIKKTKDYLESESAYEENTDETIEDGQNPLSLN